MRSGYIGNWRVYQDAPDYGCSDNPSLDWFAYEIASNGHCTGRNIRGSTRQEIVRQIEGMQQ